MTAKKTPLQRYDELPQETRDKIDAVVSVFIPGLPKEASDRLNSLFQDAKYWEKLALADIVRARYRAVLETKQAELRRRYEQTMHAVVKSDPFAQSFPNYNPYGLPASAWCKASDHLDGLACSECVGTMEAHLASRFEHGT